MPTIKKTFFTKFNFIKKYCNYSITSSKNRAELNVNNYYIDHAFKFTNISESEFKLKEKNFVLNQTNFFNFHSKITNNNSKRNYKFAK